MTLLSFDDRLRQDGNENTMRLARQTHAGMAHFAGTGPAGMTCRECRFWQHSHQWWASGGKHSGTPKASPCFKYRQLMHVSGDKVPHDALACRFFEKSEKPQPLQRPKRAGE